MKDHTFLTTYNKHYVKKPIKSLAQNHPRQEYRDPINVGFTNYLHLGSKPALESPHEEAGQFLDRRPQNYVLDADLIRGRQTKEATSEYTANFCDLLYEHGGKEAFRLPDSTRIPLTTQRSAFRNPMELTNTPPARLPLIIPMNSLDDNQQVNTILNMNPDITEYMARIGTLGEFICKNGLEKRVAKRKRE